MSPSRRRANVGSSIRLLEGKVHHALQEISIHNFRSYLRGYFSNLFLPGEGDELKTHTLKSITTVPLHVVTSTWENGVFNYDTGAAAMACRVPALYIDAGTPNTDLDHLADLCPQLMTGRTVGSGHFNQLVVPEQVNAMIERFLDLVL